MIPYHSASAQGVQINDLHHYHHRYFKPILKILDHIQPQEPVFINGFSSFANYLARPPLNEEVTFQKLKGFWVGHMGGHEFIGLPFLTRVTGGKDKLVKNIKTYMAKRRGKF